MVKKGERYKNYKELCKALGESPKTGNGKMSQLKRWGLLFKYHTDGREYVIDKVYEKALVKKDKRGGNHSPNVDLFLPYVKMRLGVSGRCSWYGTQRLLSELLDLIPPEIYEQVNNEETSKEKFCEIHGLEGYNSFLSFTHAFESVTKETFVGCMNKLAKEKAVAWEPGHMFKVAGYDNKFICVSSCEELIDQFERAVCEKLGERYKFNGKGRQILWALRDNPAIMIEYHALSLQWLLGEYAIRDALRIAGSRRHIDSDAVAYTGYYKGVHITWMDKNKLRGKAPPGEIKKEILENIFLRIKKRVSIPECDFKKLKTLFSAMIS